MAKFVELPARHSSIFNGSYRPSLFSVESIAAVVRHDDDVTRITLKTLSQGEESTVVNDKYYVKMSYADVVASIKKADSAE